MDEMEGKKPKINHVKLSEHLFKREEAHITIWLLLFHYYNFEQTPLQDYSRLSHLLGIIRK